mgnify:FL=1
MYLNPRSLASIVLTPLLSLAGLTALSIPAHAVPDDENCDLAGSGSNADPYLIGDEVELFEMKDCNIDSGVTYKLTDHIYLSGSEMQTRSNDHVSMFYGDDGAQFVFDGNGKQIHNLAIANGSSQTGLFGFVGLNDGGSVDLIVRNLTVFVDSLSGGRSSRHEAGVFAGQVQGDVLFENVNVFVKSFACFANCGTLVGIVEGDVSIDGATVTVDNFLTSGFDSGLLFGQVEGSISVAKTVAQGSFRILSDVEEGRRNIGGVAGEQASPGGDANNLTIEDSFIDFNLREEPFVDDDSYLSVGGAVGFHLPDNDSSISVDGSMFDVDFDQVRYFGGLLGDVRANNKVDLDIVDSRFDSDVFGDESASGYSKMGGLIGSLEVVPDVGAAGDATITRTVLVPDLHAETDASTELHALFEIGGADGFDSVTVTDSAIDNEEWTEAFFGKETGTTPSIIGLAELTTTALRTNTSGQFEALSFDVGDKEQGILGTDPWEFKSGSGPFPTITPNEFDTGSLTLPSNSLSLTINSAMPDFVMNDSYSSRADLIRYQIFPELPRGLTMDPISGTISGTPREITPAKSYSIRLHTADGYSPAFPSSNSEFEPPLARLTIAVSMPPTPAPEVIRDTVVIEREVPALYSGPLLTNVSKQVLSRCQNTSITLTGQDLDKLEKLYLGETEIEFEVQENQLIFTPTCVDAGEYSLKLESSGGTLDYKNMIQLVEVPTEENSFVGGLTQEKLVNAGSFKGYVAVYAKGYQGKRLSAKIGNDWVVVPSLSSNFERVTDFTGAGYDINVRIFIDGVLTREVPITTK